MPALRFVQVDVFTETPFCGNPLAVILDGQGLTGEQMQATADCASLWRVRCRVVALSRQIGFGPDPSAKLIQARFDMQNTGMLSASLLRERQMRDAPKNTVIGSHAPVIRAREGLEQWQPDKTSSGNYVVIPSL